MSDAPAPTKRGWRTYSIRSLALLVALLALLLGWVAKEREQSRREVEAADALISLGANVAYFDDLNTGQWAWISDLLGKRVEQVSIGGDHAVECFSRVSVFKKLKFLTIDSDAVRDLSPIAGLKRLESLGVYRAKIDDLTPLEGLTQLQGVLLYRTNVHDLRPLAKLTRLVGLDLSRSQVKDLTPLHHLKSLQRVRLANTPVAQSQIDSLLEALPNCQLRKLNEPW